MLRTVLGTVPPSVLSLGPGPGIPFSAVIVANPCLFHVAPDEGDRVAGDRRPAGLTVDADNDKHAGTRRARFE